MAKRTTGERRSQYKDSRGRVRSFPDLKIDGLFGEMTDCRQQFRRLLTTTDEWTDRMESLRSKQRYLRRGLTQLNATVESMRDEAKAVDGKCDRLEGRLAENFIMGVPNTEEEWRRALDGERLVAMAVDLLQRQTEEKEFYYSDDDTNETSSVITYSCCHGEELEEITTTDLTSLSRSSRQSGAESETISVYMTLSDCWTSVANLTSEEEEEDDELTEYLHLAAVNCRVEGGELTWEYSDAGFQSGTSKEDTQGSSA